MHGQIWSFSRRQFYACNFWNLGTCKGLMDNDGLSFMVHTGVMKKTSSQPHKNVVGARVKRARLRLQPILSQKALSELLAALGVVISRSGVTKIESRERYVMDYELVTLAKCLQTRTAWLLGETRSHHLV